jgi:hypothetical protein
MEELAVTASRLVRIGRSIDQVAAWKVQTVFRMLPSRHRREMTERSNLQSLGALTAQSTRRDQGPFDPKMPSAAAILQGIDIMY